MLLSMTTTLARSNDELTMALDAVLPPVGERVIVQCDGFRCVGICNESGRWLDAYDNHPLPEILWFKPFGTRKK
jgi:hypothetical protein